MIDFINGVEKSIFGMINVKISMFVIVIILYCLLMFYFKNKKKLVENKENSSEENISAVTSSEMLENSFSLMDDTSEISEGLTNTEAELIKQKIENIKNSSE